MPFSITQEFAYWSGLAGVWASCGSGPDMHITYLKARFPIRCTWLVRLGPDGTGQG